MENLSNIEKILNDLQTCIEILIEALKDRESVSLTNNDTFRSIQLCIKELEKYDNKSLREIFGYYRATLAHLNKTFSDKENISNEMIDSVTGCLKDIKILKSKIGINLPFYKFFEDLKRVSRDLNGINSSLFLKDSDTTKNCLEIYEIIIGKYERIIAGLNELRSDMKISDFDNMKLDLDVNYNTLKANLNEMYREILASNIDIADPLLNKLRMLVSHEKYESVLKTSMVNKAINNGLRRKEIINNFEMLLDSLNKIIDRYKDCKVDKSKIKIDIEIPDKPNIEASKNNDVDIPHFIEENYDRHRESASSHISNIQNISYDSKVERFIARFAVLKRKLQKRGALTKEEVKLYNKLESELDNLINGKGSFVSKIRFNYYFNKLNKKLKLFRNSGYTRGNTSTKKRK